MISDRLVRPGLGLHRGSRPLTELTELATSGHRGVFTTVLGWSSVDSVSFVRRAECLRHYASPPTPFALG